MTGFLKVDRGRKQRDMRFEIPTRRVELSAAAARTLLVPANATRAVPGNALDCMLQFHFLRASQLNRRTT